MAYTRSWSDTTPPGSQAANTIDDEIRNLRVDINERMTSIITSWTADPVVLKNQTFCLFHDVNKSTTSTSEVSITSFSLPASKLSVNGQLIRISYRGRAQTQNVIAVLKFGATQLISQTVTVANAQFVIDAIVTRSGAAAQLAVGSVIAGSGLNSFAAQPAETLSGAITIDFRGSVTAGGTLQLDTVHVEYLAV